MTNCGGLRPPSRSACPASHTREIVSPEVKPGWIVRDPAHPVVVQIVNDSAQCTCRLSQVWDRCPHAVAVARSASLGFPERQAVLIGQTPAGLVGHGFRLSRQIAATIDLTGREHTRGAGSFFRQNERSVHDDTTRIL
jgi:hypothetical protein